MGLEQLSDDELLAQRICDLPVSLARSDLQTRLSRYRAELDSVGLRLAPDLYLGDEWFSPEDVNAIAIPFFLADPRLRQLERRVMLEVEGESDDEFMKLIRHETGHCFDHAYGVSRRRRWRELFGSPKARYDPDHYRPKPYSKSYVQNLDQWYAQSHPDEDFAETFAVWLNPISQWRERYQGWPKALEKLLYVDRLVLELKAEPPKVGRGPKISEARRLTRTLAKYYQQRRKAAAGECPAFYDEDLKRLFPETYDPSVGGTPASQFLESHRKQVVRTVNRWTGAPRATVDLLVKRLVRRLDQLGLMGRSPTEESAYLEIGTYIATLVTHYQFTGRFKRKV